VILIREGERNKVFFWSDSIDPHSVINGAGIRAPFLLSYSGIQLFGKYLVLPNYISYGSIPYKESNQVYGQDPIERVVSEYSKIQYVPDQSDPRLVNSLGGNCQAIALLVYKEFKELGFETGFVLDKGLDHVYNWVIFEGVEYHIDIVEKSIIKRS
jgi:hypothetical protein